MTLPPKFKPKTAPVPAVVSSPAPKESVIAPPFFQINQARSGLHWTLMQGKSVLAGHCGPNPSTRAEAIKQIEQFKLMVANATIATEK